MKDSRKRTGRWSVALGSAGQIDKLPDAADLHGLPAHVRRLDHQFDFGFDGPSTFEQLVRARSGGRRSGGCG